MNMNKIFKEDYNSFGEIWATFDRKRLTTQIFKDSETNHKHREDGPAYISVCGGVRYYKNDKLHRIDGPAVSGKRYSQYWVNDKLHRIDGPAVIQSDGTWQHYKNGVLHNENGPASWLYPGIYEWYLNGVKIKESETLE